MLIGGGGVSNYIGDDKTAITAAHLGSYTKKPKNSFLVVYCRWLGRLDGCSLGLASIATLGLAMAGFGDGWWGRRLPHPGPLPEGEGEVSFS